MGKCVICKKVIEGNKSICQQCVNNIFNSKPNFNKFGAKRTTIDGITFDSKLEADRYIQLKLLEKAGKITVFSRKNKKCDGGRICIPAVFRGASQKRP